MKPTGEEEPSPSQEQLEENFGQQGGQGRLDLEADRKVCPKQNEMVGGFHGPMHQEEWKGISQVI